MSESAAQRRTTSVCGETKLLLLLQLLWELELWKILRVIIKGRFERDCTLLLLRLLFTYVQRE